MADFTALERPDVRATTQNDKDGDRGGIAQIAAPGTKGEM